MEDSVSETGTGSKKQKESFSILPPRKKVAKRGHKKKLPPSKRRECLVKGCPYRYDRKLQIKPYSLPEDPDLRALWVGFASLSGSVKIRARSGICKAHFREDQFNLSDLLKAKYGFINKEPRLKKTAVPTLLSEELKKRIQQSWTEGKQRRNWKGVLESLNFAADKNSNMLEDAGLNVTTQRPMPTPTRTPVPHQEIRPESTRGLFGGGYHGLSVGDFCLPESAPKQEATWFEKKPSPEELAMASQAALASADKAAITQDPPVLPVPLSMQSTQQQSISVMVKDEPISDSEESTFSIANPQQHAEEEIPSPEIPENTVPTIVTREGFQRNTSILMASAPPPQEQTVRPLFQENEISSGEQASMQQSSQENVQSAMERHESGPENVVLKKILAMHQGMFPASSPKQIKIKKTNKGIVAVVVVPKETKDPVAPASASTALLKKPTILKTRSMPTKIIKLAITKTHPSQPQPKHNKRKSEHLTKVVPEEEDEAEEGWEEIKDEDDISRREAKTDTDEELNEEDEFRRAAETVEECAQSTLESDSDGGFDQENEADLEAAESVEEYPQSVQDDDGGLDQGYEAEMEEAEEVNEIEYDTEEEVRKEEEEEYEEEDDEEDFEEESFDDPNDSDYDPFQDIDKSALKKKTRLGKPVTELEISSSDYSVSSFNTDEEDEKYPKKKKQKTRKEWTKRYSLSGDERRKHNLKLQLAKSRRLRLECRLCKDSFCTIQEFQLHFEEEHPGEAEKLVTDLQLTLERKRIAFREQKEKEAEERKEQMMLKMKKLEKKKQKKTTQKEKMQSKEIADLESQPRKSTRLGLKKVKKVTESAESNCDNYGNERQRLELYSSTSELELDSKPSHVYTNDQSNQGAYDASMKEAELQSEEENGTKALTDMTVEETEPRRDKENEDINTNTDITVQKADARRDKETKILMDSILQDIEQSEAENEDSVTKIHITMQESDAQMDKESEDGKNPISAAMQETYAPRENKREEIKNLMQEYQNKNFNKNQESETSDKLQTAKLDHVEESNVSIEHIGERKLDLDNSCKNKKLSHSEPSEMSVKTDNKTEAENAPQEANENSHSAFESSLTESTDTVNLNKIIDGQAVEQEHDDQACKLGSKFDAKMQLDVRSQASADGGTVENPSEPISCEPASEDSALLLDKNAEFIEPEKVEFVPEDDEDVVFELDVWSNILLECTECSGYFEYKKYNSHLNEHEEERKTNECERCGRRYLTEKNLRFHQKDCSGEPKGKKKRNFEYGVCEICGKYVSNVKQHLRVHKTDTFACKICNAVFQRKAHRDRHILVHSSVKEHVCEICGRSFSQASNMRGHMRQHTQEKPYKCNMCEKSFVHNVSLKTHQKRDHGMDPWLGTNTASVGRRKKVQGDSSENTAKKGRTRKKETEECSSGETAVKRKKGRKKK